MAAFESPSPADRAHPEGDAAPVTVTRAAPVGRARLRTIAGLSLPIVGGMVSQNVLNLVDTAMVGSQGEAALAAVGTGSFANFLATAFITGLSVGVQAMAARRLGEGRLDRTAVPLNGALLVDLVAALPLAAVLYLLAPPLFPWLNDDPAVVALAVPYLQARLLALPAVGANFAFRGYWNGVNRSALYLRTLVVMHAANVFLNWVFIYGHLGAPAMGAVGAGVASAIATWVGTVTYFVLGWTHAREGGFLRGLPDAESLRTMLRLSVPSGVQSSFFAAGFTALFWILGEIGTAATAAASVLINVTLVAILPGLALGLAAGSLVGQALGREDPEDARRWGWDVVRVALVVMGLLGLPMVLLPDLILSGFLPDADTIALASAPLRLVGATLVVDAVGMVLLNALNGAGATRATLVVSAGLQWGLFLPAAWVLGPVLGHGLLAVWIAQVAYRALQALILAGIWQRGRWADIRL